MPRQLRVAALAIAVMVAFSSDDTEAYLAYLKGRYYWNKRMEGVGFAKAIQYFNQALEKDPSYALAYTV